MQYRCLLRYNCTYFFQKHYEAYKANQTGAALQALPYYNEDDLFSLEVVYKPVNMIVLLTMT